MYPGQQFPERLTLAYNDHLPAKNHYLVKITAWIAALKTLGAWGLLLLATIDNVAIPMPVDALVVGYAYANPHRAWLYCIAAALGGALGSLVPYGLGRAGGELFLLKRIDEGRLQRIRDRFEKQEFLALMIPAMLPPPTPFKLFVFASGVFEMKVVNFLLAIFAGRVARFGILSVLTVFFGPEIVNQAKYLFKNHLGFTLAVVAGAIALAYVIYRLMRAPVAEVAHEISEQEHRRNKAQE